MLHQHEETGDAVAAHLRMVLDAAAARSCKTPPGHRLVNRSASAARHGKTEMRQGHHEASVAKENYLLLSPPFPRSLKVHLATPGQSEGRCVVHRPPGQLEVSQAGDWHVRIATSPQRGRRGAALQILLNMVVRKWWCIGTRIFFLVGFSSGGQSCASSTCARNAHAVFIGVGGAT